MALSFLRASFLVFVLILFSYFAHINDDWIKKILKYSATVREEESVTMLLVRRNALIRGSYRLLRDLIGHFRIYCSSVVEPVFHFIFARTLLYFCLFSKMLLGLGLYPLRLFPSPCYIILPSLMLWISRWFVMCRTFYSLDVINRVFLFYLCVFLSFSLSLFHSLVYFNTSYLHFFFFTFNQFLVCWLMPFRSQDHLNTNACF